MKKTVTLFLILCLCLGLLSGCGKTGDKAPNPGETPSAEVYTAAFRPLELEEGSWLKAWALDGDCLYIACQEKLGEGEIPEGEVPEYEGQYDIYGTRLYKVTADGGKTPLAYELADSQADPEEAAGREQYSTGASVQQIFLGPEGGLLLLVERYRSWYDGPDDLEPEQSEDYWNYFRSENSYQLLSLDDEGQLMTSCELQLPPEKQEGYLNTWNSTVDDRGRLYTSDDQGVCVFGADGSLAAEIPADGWINGFVRLSDGRVLAQTYGQRGQELRMVDADKASLGERFNLEEHPNQIFAGGGDWDLIFSSGTWLYGYSLDQQKSEKILDLLSCDLTGDALQAMAVAEDGAILVLSWDRGGEGSAPELATLSRVARESVPERTVLTLGALSPDAVSQAVLKFNRSQDRVRIEVKDYSELVYGSGEYEDYQSALTKLSTEIMSGSMPDLLLLDGMPYRQLAVKGLLEDLYPYLDADAQLSRDDFFESVLKSMEVGGKLCQVSPSFSIMTLMGASSVVGDTPGWTYEELNAALATMPEGCTVLGPYTGRDQMLQMCLYLDMDSFVDWETGECRFDSPDFLALLDFVNGFPQEVNYEGDGSENTMSRIAAGKQMLIDVGVYDLDDLNINEQILGGDATYIGFPTSHGVGNILYANGGIAMSSQCRDKEAAWSFLRQFLAPDFQIDRYGGLPLNRERFDKLLAEAMKVEYERDENGNYKLDPETGERIPMSKGGMGMSMGGDAMIELTIYPMTQAQADKLLDLINNSTRSVDMNTYIYGIVREELEAYFAGQKSAEEVAKLIQSKVSLYVNEQR